MVIGFIGPVSQRSKISLLVMPTKVANLRIGGTDWAFSKYSRALSTCPHFWSAISNLSAIAIAWPISGVHASMSSRYVVAPGATLPDGRGYRLSSGSLTEIPNLPEGLNAFLWSLKGGTKTEAKAKRPSVQTLNDTTERERPYALTALRGEAEAVAAAVKGTRNRTLYNAALKIGTLLLNGGVTDDEAEAKMTEAGMRAGLEQREIRMTIRSGFQNGSASPRQTLTEQDAQLRKNVEITGANGLMPPSISAPLPPPQWADPKPLPSELSPVDPFRPDFLPVEVADWVKDIADRMQCPPDFVAVSVIVALGAGCEMKEIGF